MKKHILITLLSFSCFNLLAQDFIEQTSISLAGAYQGSVAWGDYDNDGYLDILLTGATNLSASAYISKIYRNDHSGNFTEQAGIVLPGIFKGSANWFDYNNDSNLDILLTGFSTTGGISRIYRNNGNNTFTYKDGISLPGLQWSSAATGDYNNDGKYDILLSGWSTDGTMSKVFRNEEGINFSVQEEIELADNEGGSVLWADLDNNGYSDIIITGCGHNKIYRNNGNNSFTPIFDLPRFEYSSASVSDYDGDGDLDCIVTGRYSSTMQTRIFKNSGNFKFIQQTISSLQGVFMGSISWGDYDNDGYPDILLAGENSSGNKVSKIYHNDSGITFSEVNMALANVSLCSAAWGDYDNDKDLDILICGLDESGNPVTKLYKNMCATFNAIPNVPTNLSCLIQNSSSIITWDRVTDDKTASKSISYNLRIGRKSNNVSFVSPHSALTGTRKIVTMGNSQLSNTFILKNLYWDTTYFASVQAIDNAYSGGAFSTEIQFKIDPVQVTGLYAKHIDDNSIELKWTRGNGDRCIVFAKKGTSGNFEPINNTTYYANSVFGDSPPIGTTGWFCIYKGSADSVILSGMNKASNYVIQVFEYKGKNGSEIYTTNNSGNTGVFSSGLFTMTDFALTPGDGSWIDYDNDGDLDIFITGRVNTYQTKIYRNINNTFTEQINILPYNLRYSSAAWADYDNDNDQDLLVAGDFSGTFITKILINNGNNTFSPANIDLPGVYKSVVAWFDYDNDGFLDIFLSGNTGSVKISKIYHNNGDNTFSELAGTTFFGTEEGSVSIGDCNLDGYADILLCGSGYTKIYLNKKDNTFSELTSLVGISSGAVRWGDEDNDGDLDIILTGHGLTRIYNNTNGNFIEKTGLTMAGVAVSSCAWGDYNNDGIKDVAYSGLNANGSITKIYRNNGTGTYSIESAADLIGVYWASLNWGDYDNDGDLDILLGGQTDNVVNITSVYRNNLIMNSGSIQPNNKPAAPQGISVMMQPNLVRLSWNKVDGDETQSQTMNYNLRLREENSSVWKYAPQSLNSGYKLVPDYGNRGSCNFMNLQNLPSGIYQWQVQAVDQAYAGGPWSEVSSFEVKTVQSFFSSDEVCHGLPTHFTDQSVATAGVVSWKWDFRDGTISTSQNPIHTYSASGTYNVKLVITDAGGTKDSLEQAVIVKPRPLTGFDAQSVCQGIPVTAANTTNNNGLTISSWRWDFGDTGAGNISYLQQPPPHPYLSPDDYTIKLKAIASNGCADSVSHDVSVGSYPVAAVTSSGPLSFCKGDSVTLTVPLNPGYTYRWRISGTDLTGATANTFKAKLSGNYTVEITNPKGSCRSTSPSVSVTAFDAPSAPLISLSGNTTFCEGDSVTLTIAPVAGNTYDWKLNGGSVGTGSSHSAKSSGIYSLVVSNASGCKANSTNTVALIVNPKPLLTSISSSGSTTFCDGESVGLSVTLNPGLTYSWRNENGPIPGADKNSFSALSSGSYRLDIGNSFGCSVRTLPVNVLVKERPAKPLLDSTNYVKGKCPGDNPIKLSVKEPSDRYEYTWYRDGFPLDHEATYIDVYESGYYQLTASLNGCTAESRVFNADFPAGPAKPLIYAQGPSLWYLASSVIDAAKYRWYYNGKLIEEADKYFYVANYKLGQYQVSIGDKDGCYTRSDIITIPPGYTGADDAEPFEGIRIYPNPSSGLVTIEIDNNIFGKLSLEIISPDGKRIKKSEIEKTGQHLLYQTDLTGQPEGIYIISLVLNNYRTTRKILIK